MPSERQRIGRNDRCTRISRQECQQQADGTLANDTHNFVANNASLVNRLQARVHRFNKYRLFRCNIVRDMHHSSFNDPRHYTDVLCKPSSVGLEPRSNANLLILRTLREQLTPTVKECATRNMLKADDALADRPFQINLPNDAEG